MRRFAYEFAIAWGVLSVAGVACDAAGDAPADDDAAADQCANSDAPAQLTIQNRTGNAMAEITMRACDGSDLVSTPIPGTGLATGEDLTIDLPAPGCWILSYVGDDCFNDPKHQTPEAVCGGDTHVWLAGADTHVCAGGGW